MDSILVPIAFSWLTFVGCMNFFKFSTSIITGVIAFLITHAYSVFDLPDEYIVTVIILFFVLYIVTLIILKFRK